MSDFSEEFAIELGLRLKNGAIASIQQQLNQLSGQVINLNIGGSVDTSGVKQEVDKLVNDVNKSTEKIEPLKIISAADRTAFEQEISGIIQDEEALQKTTRKYFGQFGSVTTKAFRDAQSQIRGFIVEITKGKDAIESLTYSYSEELDELTGNPLFSGYRYRGSKETDNYTKSVEQAIKQEQAHERQIDRNNAAVTRYTAVLEKYRKAYEDQNANKPITKQEHLDELNALYDEAIAKVNALQDATKNNYASLDAEANAAITTLSAQIEVYRRAGTAANQLRAKPIETIRQDEINLLREFESRVKASGIALDKFKDPDIFNKLNQQIQGVSNPQSLMEYLNLLSNVKTEFKALEQEQKVSSQQQKQYADDINSDYQSLLNIMKEIGSTQISLLKADPERDSEKINVLKQRLSELYDSYTTLFDAFEILAPQSVVRELNDEWLKIEKVIELVKAEVTDTTAEKKAQQEIKQQTELYEKLLTVAKQIKDLRVKIGNATTGENNDEYLKILHQRLTQVTNQYNLLSDSLKGKLDNTQIDKLNALFTGLSFELNEINAKAKDLQQKLANDIQVKITDKTFEGQISSLETKFQKLHINSQEINDDFTKLRSLMANMDGNDDIESVNADYQEYLRTLTNVKNKIVELQRQQQSQRDSVNLTIQRSNLSSQIDVWLHKNSAAARQFSDELERIKAQISSADKIKLSQLKSQFQDVKRQAELAGKTGLSLVDGFKRSLKTVSTYFSGMMLITRSISLIRKMYTNVLQVDTAMTELYRVTDLTSSQYSKLYDNMTNSAKNYGATLDSIIKSTASWVRLGFDAETSNKLAEITSMYQHVTDLDESTAVKNLVTAYKGYQSELLQVSGGDSAKAVTKVADVYDKIGNEFAISASDIGESMRRSAASLEMAGNTFEEAVGMNTGIAEVTQNAEQAGTAINVVSLRLRGMKGQLEEIGEEVDENVESISKMQTHILNLTNGKVNIFKDNGDFKSTYQIFKEIDAVWKDLTDTSQADLLETIAGKQRANAIAALLNNFSQAEKAVQAASNAEGTATKENEKYLKSMQGRIDSMKASAQALSNSFLSSDLLKGLISDASTLLNITDGLIKNFGALPTLIAAVTAALSFKNIGRDRMFSLKMNMPIVIIVLTGYGQFRYYAHCDTMG